MDETSSELGGGSGSASSMPTSISLGRGAIPLANSLASRASRCLPTGEIELCSSPAETGGRIRQQYRALLAGTQLLDKTSVSRTLVPNVGATGVSSLQALRPGGLRLDVRGAGSDRAVVRARAAAIGRRVVEFGFTPSGADQADRSALIAQGVLRVAIAHGLPLEAAARAHGLSEAGGVRGKPVLVVGRPGAAPGLPADEPNTRSKAPR
jgi:hypothetical protein